MANELLLTGATGYIGGHLLRMWHDRTDQRINVLARSRRNLSPEERIDTAMREIDPTWPKKGIRNRIRILEGDISLERMGLASRLYEKLTRDVSEIIHCAAAARFDLPLDEARKTNVGGVENIIDFASQCRYLNRIDYVGTAYVAGMRAGLILEDELDSGQEHRNSYEQSKYEAEILLRKWRNRLPIAVSRPSIVICDSKSGKASSHNGFYRAVKAYLLYGLNMIPGEPSSILDLVPVDYVCEALFRISKNPDTTGKTYHLTAGSKATTLGTIRDLSSKCSSRSMFEIVHIEEMNNFITKAKPALTDEQNKIFDEMNRYVPYLFCQSTFDNRNCIKDTELQAPEIQEYFKQFAERILKEAGERS
jgi:thioester reductase-like protein